MSSNTIKAGPWEIISQTQVLEKNTSLKMFELSKSYLISIEKKFWVFLSKIWMNQGNYDGNLNWNKTWSEKVYNETILPIKQKIETEKINLKKQDLMTQLTRELLIARGLDMETIEKLAREHGKQKEFQKEFGNIKTENEKTKKEIEQEFLKLDTVYINGNETKNTLDKAKLRNTLSEGTKKAMEDYKDKKITKEMYENTIESNMKKAREAGIELEVTKNIWDYFNLWMQSGTFPIGMMMIPKVKNALPMLPSVIWIWIWARAVSLTNGTQSVWEKSWEWVKLVWETALTIAPLTWTFLAGKETVEAYKRYRNGRWSMSEVVANWVGTWVSAVFDWVTVFLVATWIWAAPAIWLQAVRSAAKEAVKWWVKSLIGMIWTKVSEKWAEWIVENVAIHWAESTASKAAWLLKITGDFFKWKINLIKTAHQKLWTKEFLKRTARQWLEDTVLWMWDMVTLRGIRDSKLISKLPESMKIFEKWKKATAGVRSSIVEKFEKVWLAKWWSAERIRLRWTAWEFRLANDDANDMMRQDDGAAKVERIHANYQEDLSTKHLDEALWKLKDLILRSQTEDVWFEAVLSWIKTQDEYSWLALNILHKLSDKLSDHSQNKEKLISEMGKIILDNKWKISKSLYEYLERVLVKIKAGEDFSQFSWNYLVVMNKIWWKSSVEQSKWMKWYEDYQTIIKNWEHESTHWYMWNYQKSLQSMSELLFSWKIKWAPAEIFVKEYLEIIKNAERSGWWTIRLETLIPDFADQIKAWTLKNGYEWVVASFLNMPEERIKEIEYSFISNLDLSLLHNAEIKQQVIDRWVNLLKNWMDYNSSMELIKKLSFYEDYRWLLNNKFNPKRIISQNIPIQLSANISWDWYIINNLYKEAKTNDDLFLLLNFAKEENKNKIWNSHVTKEKIKKDILKNLDSLKIETITKAQLDTVLKDLKKLWGEDIKKWFDLLIKKFWESNKELQWKPHEEIIKIFMVQIESYEATALFCKTYPNERDTLIKRIINGKSYSIEYKIRFIEELGKNWLENNKLSEKFATYLLTIVDDVSFIKKLDHIESFYKWFDDSIKELKALKDKINLFKKSDVYISQTQRNQKIFIDLIDIDKSFSDRDIKDLKNNGSIDFKTLSDIEEVIKNGYLKNKKWEITKTYSGIEMEKIKIIKEKVNTALNNYELNLFNHSEYKKRTNDKEKADYIFDKIDEMTWFKFRDGSINTSNLDRTIVKQLNVLKTNFNIESHIIDLYLYKVLKYTNIEWFHIKQKIKLLETLERTWIIKPSVEQKQEYVIKMWVKDANEMRQFTHVIKEYTKDFEKLLGEWNKIVRELKDKWNTQGILAYVKKTLWDRVAVDQKYIDSKPELKEWFDYVKIDGKIYTTEVYTGRYFMTQFLNAKNISQKESYMELIHNKTEFGWKKFREYFDEMKKTGDIESLILMSYHDEIKYDADVINLLQREAKKYPQLVTYVLGKRKDYDIIIWNEIHEKWKTVQLTEKILNETLTKSYIEWIEWRKLSDEEYAKIKYGIIKMFQLQKDPKFQRILIAIKWTDDFIWEDGKLKKDHQEFIIKYQELFKNIEIEINGKKENIFDLVNSKYGKEILWAIKRLWNKIDSGLLKAWENITSIRQLLEDSYIRRTLVWWIREWNESDYHISDKNKVAVMLWIAVKSWTENLKENPNWIWNTKVNFDKIINSNILQNIKNSWNKDLYKTFMSIKENATPKNIMFTLITLKLMTPTESQAATQEIWDKWTSSPEYKKYQELGWEKSAEARAIKEKAITAITREVLAVYIQSFDPKYQELMDRKVKELPIGLQWFIGNINIRIKEKLNPWYDSMAISKVNNYIFNIMDSVYKWKWTAEKNINDMVTKFPELAGTEIVKNLLMFWKDSDWWAKRDVENEKWRKIWEQLKKL